MFKGRIAIVILLTLAAFAFAADYAQPSDLTFGQVMQKAVEAEKAKITDVVTDGVVKFITALVTIVSGFMIALITATFQFLRSKFSILKYTQADEKIEQMLIDTWVKTRQGTFDRLKKEKKPGQKISWDDAKVCMEESIHGLYNNFKEYPELFQHIGVESMDEFKDWARNQFEHVTDILKGKISMPVIGGKAKLTIGNVKSPVIGSELKGFQISTKW